MSPKTPNLKSVQRLFKPKKKKKKNIKVGLAPGTLVYTGEKELQQVTINLISYDENELIEESILVSQLEQKIQEKKKVLWIDIVGLHDVELLEKIGLLFNIHKLTLEDILNVDQRPKMEAFEDYIFAALKMIQCQSPDSPIDDEQISFVLKNGILLTFQEKKGDVFQSVRNRLADQKRAIRQRKADYLLYALLDAVIDNYFIVMENIGERIENLESQAILSPGNETLNALYLQRREMMDLRRTVYPLREVIGSLINTQMTKSVKKPGHLSGICMKTLFR